MSDLWATEYKPEDIESLTDVSELVITKKIGSGNATDADTRNRSLTAMRKVLIDAQNVMVAVGGKMHGMDGFIPGVGEEMQLAERKGIPQFLVGGLGGFARKLAKDLAPSSLHNSLSRKANVELFGTTDVAACVNVLFEHLARSKRLTKSALQPVKWNPALQMILDHRDGTVMYETTRYIARAIVA